MHRHETLQIVRFVKNIKNLKTPVRKAAKQPPCCKPSHHCSLMDAKQICELKPFLKPYYSWILFYWKTLQKIYKYIFRILWILSKEFWEAYSLFHCFYHLWWTMELCWGFIGFAIPWIYRKTDIAFKSSMNKVCKKIWIPFDEFCRSVGNLTIFYLHFIFPLRFLHKTFLPKWNFHFSIYIYI